MTATPLTDYALELSKTRVALFQAVQLLRKWYLPFLGSETEQWARYYCKSPEMASIRAVLGKDPTKQRID